MSQLRQIISSVGIGIILTVVLVFGSASDLLGTGAFLLPGILGELILTTIIAPIGDPEAFSLTHEAWGGNAVFYSVCVYGSIWLIRALRWFGSELKAEKRDLSATPQSNTRLERTRQ